MSTMVASETDVFAEVTTYVRSMDRTRLKSELLAFEGRVRLDFTDDFLERLSIDELRHVFASAVFCLKSQDEVRRIVCGVAVDP